MAANDTMKSPRSDPYRDWLGITSEDRPPNHYQLLGLDEFENDCAKISAAFEYQFRNIRRYEVGVRSEEVSVRLGSYPGDGEGDRAIEAPGTEVRFGRASECTGRNASEA